jgi:hypothetical protein
MLNKIEGELKPAEEVEIEVTFKGLRPQKFAQKVTLVA